MELARNMRVRVVLPGRGGVHSAVVLAPYVERTFKTERGGMVTVENEINVRVRYDHLEKNGGHTMALISPKNIQPL